jgi:hypothetical protein
MNTEASERPPEGTPADDPISRMLKAQKRAERAEKDQRKLEEFRSS